MHPKRGGLPERDADLVPLGRRKNSDVFGPRHGQSQAPRQGSTSLPQRGGSRRSEGELGHGRGLSLRLAKIYYDPKIFADQESAKKNTSYFEQSDHTILLELTPTRIRSY